jgi:hypothetical protein
MTIVARAKCLPWRRLAIRSPGDFLVRRGRLKKAAKRNGG